MNVDDSLLELLGRWEDGFEMGLDSPAEAICQESPELVGALAEHIVKIKQMHWLQKDEDCDLEIAAPPFTRTIRSGPRSILRQPGDEPIPGYRLRRQLGQGGFGQVWEIEDPQGCPKAIKFCDNLDDPWRQRAKLEFRGLQQIKEIRHPFVIATHRIDYRNGQLLIVCELADSSADNHFRSMPRALDPNYQRRFPTEARELFRFCRFLVRDAADGLDFIYEAHELQHLDVKPANLLIKNNRCKIGDFGTVAHIKSSQREAGPMILYTSSDSDSEGVQTEFWSWNEIPWQQAMQRNATLFTLTGAFTPYYAPPEAFMGRFSRSFDQYSLALTFCELAAGKSPFTGEGEAQIQQRIRGDFDLTFLPQELRSAVGKALSPDPEARFGSCKEFVKALGDFQSGSTIRRELPRDDLSISDSTLVLVGKEDLAPSDSESTLVGKEDLVSSDSDSTLVGKLQLVPSDSDSTLVGDSEQPSSPKEVELVSDSVGEAKPNSAQLPYIRLTTITGERKSWSFQRSVNVGRRKSSNLPLNTSSVSRKHALIWHDGQGWWLKDLRSTNGTFWNRVRVFEAEAVPIRTSDIIQVGNTAFVVESVDPSDSIDSPSASDASDRDFGTADTAHPNWQASSAVLATDVGNAEQPAPDETAKGSKSDSTLLKQSSLVRPPYIRLRCANGKHLGRICSYRKAIQIGGHSSSNLCLSDSSVSDAHAVIWYDAGEWWLSDKANGHGTCLNGVRVQQQQKVGPLHESDLIIFGSVAFVVESLVDPGTIMDAEPPSAHSDPTDVAPVRRFADQSNFVPSPISQEPVRVQGPDDAKKKQPALNIAAPDSCSESAMSNQTPVLRPPQIRLRCLNGKENGRIWSFQEAIHVGRLLPSNFRLEASSVSRTHAVIWNDGNDWWLADRGSTNGTFKNGVQVEKQRVVGPLRESDVVQFGKVAFFIESLTGPGTTMLPCEGKPQTHKADSSSHRTETTGETALDLGPVRVGKPTQYKSLAVFPLFTENNSSVKYLLADEAVKMGVVTVGEVSKDGNVPELRVENRGDLQVLFLEGEELRGSKQNRILNTSVLIPARSSIVIPVSCVEQNRWEQNCEHSSPSLTMVGSHMRYTLKNSVYQSLRKYGRHDSDQGSVWNDVKSQQETLGVYSPTSSMEDTFVAFEEQLSEARRGLPYVEGSGGLAVAIGPQIVCVDLLDKPSTCQKVWDRLLSGLIIEEKMAGQSTSALEIADVETLLSETRLAHWEQNTTIGEGQEYRAEFNDKTASALRVEGALVHFSLVTRLVERR